MKDVILATVDDLVYYFLFYDRRNDKLLGRNRLLKAINSGEVTVEEIVSAFKQSLLRDIKGAK